MRKDMSTTQDRHFNPSVMLFPLRRYMSRSQYDFMSAHVKEGMAVLDLGSGPGFFTSKLSKLVGKKGEVYAVDGDEAAIERLRKRNLSLNITNVRTYVSSAASIPFVESESVDIVMSNGLLCCMVDHKGAVNEIARVMKPNAKGYISVSKMLRKDKLGVTKEEWNGILSSFDLIKKGSSAMMDWAIFSKSGADEK